jgi:alkylation response protein AidB-like acyl-CoA dehydrogenase
MNLDYPAPVNALRADVRDFLREHLPPQWNGIGELNETEAAEFVISWRHTLASGGYLGVGWPPAYGGRGMSPVERAVIAEEFAFAGVPQGGPNDIHGIQMLGNTLLELGTERQKKDLLPRILSGEDVWCQGFSEPDVGSDLAGVSCSAILDGDKWVINGQKVWSSAAQFANWVFLLARTDRDADRHRGISFLLCPLDQPGVEVRPLAMLSGDQEFNEIFFTDACTDVGCIVGERNEGWVVAMTLLGFERGESLPATAARFRAELNRLLALSRANGAARNVTIRQKLAQSYIEVENLRFLGYRILTTLSRGERPGPESSIAKLHWSEYHAKVTELGVAILGSQALILEGRPPHGAFQIDDPGTPNSSAAWVGQFLNARGMLIAAGTSEIQRNIIAEKVLGLPKDISPSVQRPTNPGRMEQIVP